MRRIKRPTKRVADTGQQGFGFCYGNAPSAEERKPIADSRFKEDDPYHLIIGDQRLDQLLRAHGCGWVVELRKLLARLDYSLLTCNYSERGRKAFHPRTLLGLIVFGMFVKHHSLRELEGLSAMHLGAMWICGGHHIDHSTVGRFVQEQQEVLSGEFFIAMVGWVVKELRLRSGVSSIDGTVIESAGSHWQAIQAEAARLAAEQSSQAASAEPDNEKRQATANKAMKVAAAAQERCEKRQQQGKPTETVVVVPSDPEAVVQPRKDGPMRPGYKASTMMHESGVIISQYVDASSETAAVQPLLKNHQRVFETLPQVLLLDAGYHSGPLLSEIAQAGIDVLCPSGKAMGDDDWEKKGSKGLFAKNEFHYDESGDVYECQAGEALHFADQGKDSGGRSYRRYRTSACERCPLREQCTTSAHGRSIKRYASEEYKEAMAQVLSQPRARSVYRRRMGIAEPVRRVALDLPLVEDEPAHAVLPHSVERGGLVERILEHEYFNFKKVLRIRAASMFVIVLRTGVAKISLVLFAYATDEGSVSAAITRVSEDKHGVR